MKFIFATIHFVLVTCEKSWFCDIFNVSNILFKYLLCQFSASLTFKIFITLIKISKHLLIQNIILNYHHIIIISLTMMQDIQTDK